MFRYILAIAACALVFTPLSEAAPISDSADQVVIGLQRVEYGDIDVHTSVGADRFLRRAQDAANAACGLSFSEQSQPIASREQTCVSDLLEPALAHLSSAALNELYARKTQPFVFG